MKFQNLKSLSEEKCISVFTLRKFVKNGLPHYRLGRKILVDPEEFDDWFRQHFKASEPSADRDLRRLVQETLMKLT
jgi:hypothetical protein